MSASPSYYRSYRERYPNRVRATAETERGITWLSSRQNAGESKGVASSDLVLSLLTEGQIAAEIDVGAGVRRITCQPGHFMVNVPGCPAHYLLDSPHQTIGLSAPRSRVEPLIAAANVDWTPETFAHLHEAGGYDPLVMLLLQTIGTELTAGAPHGTLFADEALGALVTRLLCIANHCEATSAAKGGLAPWQERRAVEFLAARVAENVALDEVAGLVSLSTFHFARMFKRSTGLPPHAFQRRLRCERAKELLTTSDLSITWIAAQVGYETPQAFARMFRVETGTTPSAWRRDRRS